MSEEKKHCEDCVYFKELDIRVKLLEQKSDKMDTTITLLNDKIDNMNIAMVRLSERIVDKTTLSDMLKPYSEKLLTLEKADGNKAIKVLTYIATAIGAGIISFILARIGMV